MTATITIADFAAAAMADMPGVTDAAFRRHVLRALIEFCERTHIWQEALDDLYYVAGVVDYDLSPPSQSMLVAITSLKQSGVNLELRPLVDFTYHNPTLTFLHTYQDETIFTMRGALRPAMNATAVPAKLYDRWFYPISAGAKGRYLNTPLGKHRDVEAVLDLRREFEVGIGEAKLEIANQASTGQILVAYPVG